MYLEQLKYLIAIDQYHSISAAANNLFVTQQNISFAIKELESEFGETLVIRDKRGSFLTRKGMRLAKLADNFFQEYDSLKNNQQTEKLSDLIVAMNQHETENQQYWKTIFHYFHHTHSDIALSFKDTSDISHDELKNQIVFGHLFTDELQQHKTNQRILNYKQFYYIGPPKNYKNKISLDNLRELHLYFTSPYNESCYSTRLLLKFPQLEVKNKCFFDVPPEEFIYLFKNDPAAACLAPLSPAEVLLTEQKLAEHGLADKCSVLKLTENLLLHYCFFTNMDPLPDELIQCLTFLSNKN